MQTLHDYLNKNIGLSDASLSKFILSIVTIFILWIVRLLILRIVWKQNKNIKVRYQWKRVMSIIIPMIGIILIAGIWMHAFKQFGAFLGLFSAGLAIALKDPLTNLAAWFFITFRKPFVVGDRIQIGQHAGDVIDIRLFQFTILEIGNWVDADQSTGRIIHIPNGKVLLESQANYSTAFEYIWNEIPVLLTFESNWESAKKILLEIINQHAEHISKGAERDIFEASKNYMIYYRNLTPIIYTKVKDSGVELTIRYLCNPRRRRGSEDEIWQNILLQFNQHPDIEFAYPTTRFYTQGEEKH